EPPFPVSHPSGEHNRMTTCQMRRRWMCERRSISSSKCESDRKVHETVSRLCVDRAFQRESLINDEFPDIFRKFHTDSGPHSLELELRGLTRLRLLHPELRRIIERCKFDPDQVVGAAAALPNPIDGNGKYLRRRQFGSTTDRIVADCFELLV